MRAFGGLIAGVLLGFVIAIAATIVAIAFNPLPTGFDAKSQADLVNYYLNAPFPTLFTIVVGRFAGALAGGWAAIAISGQRWLAWPIGVILSLYLLVEMSSIPHPLWMQITGVIAPLIGAAVAHHLGGRSRPLDEMDAGVEEDDAASKEVHEL